MTLPPGSGLVKSANKAIYSLCLVSQFRILCKEVADLDRQPLTSYRLTVR